MNYMKRLFQNNGVARGWLYVLIAALTVILADLTAAAAWLWEHQEELRARAFDQVDWIVLSMLTAKTLVAAGLAGFVSLRAYIDQHLSNAKKNLNPPSAPGPAPQGALGGGTAT